MSKKFNISDKLSEYISDYNKLEEKSNLEDFILTWGNIFTICIYEEILEKDIIVGLKCILFGDVDNKNININAEVSYIQKPEYNIFDEINESIIEKEIHNGMNFLKKKEEEEDSNMEKWVAKLMIKEAEKEISDEKDKKRKEFIKMMLSNYRIDFKLIDCKVKEK